MPLIQVSRDLRDPVTNPMEGFLATGYKGIHGNGGGFLVGVLAGGQGGAVVYLI